MYEIRLGKAVQKQLDAIRREDYRHIYEKLRKLSEEPRPEGCVKLDLDLFRIRSGAYRVIYSVLDDQRIVLIVKVARRSEKTYRDVR